MPSGGVETRSARSVKCGRRAGRSSTAHGAHLCHIMPTLGRGFHSTGRCRGLAAQGLLVEATSGSNTLQLLQQMQACRVADGSRRPGLLQLWAPSQLLWRQRRQCHYLLRSTASSCSRSRARGSARPQRAGCSRLLRGRSWGRGAYQCWYVRLLLPLRRGRQLGTGNTAGTAVTNASSFCLSWDQGLLGGRCGGGGANWGGVGTA